ncbi:HAD-IB family hydrolase [Streptomyces sp. HNM0663]|uniref:HAD-IB family hydrolase n=1 Tax=Streptomyces chengmaiensis TaxID=3040919 RepID=A0ABT6HFD4_9ACTN|nr:HAD-IB family hydrolase [Streptomyces chengmaiensis]MDH2387383.1 HAD-IB family hydrolase [Streptomyces chengmaiensis]
MFSDVDETLLNGKSLFDFLDFYFTGRYGADGARHAAGTRRRIGALVAAGSPREVGNRVYYEAWRGERLDAVTDWGTRWFARRSGMPGFYVPAVRAALREHQNAGDHVVLVSGSLPAVLDPVAVDAGARHVLCTRPEVRDGVLTGAVVGEPCIGEGKRRAVRGLAERYPGISLSDCYGYGDHSSDLPMLTEVGHPVVVGGSPELLARIPDARVLPGGGPV